MAYSARPVTHPAWIDRGRHACPLMRRLESIGTGRLAFTAGEIGKYWDTRQVVTTNPGKLTAAFNG